MSEVIRRVTQEQKDLVGSIPIGTLPTITDSEDYAMAEQLSAQAVETKVDFDLKKNAINDARKIKEVVKQEAENKKIAENMKTWRMQLSTVESDEELIQIAREFDVEILIEALTRNVNRVDKTHQMFCKKEDRAPMHNEALNKIKEDMESEYNEIKPYLIEAEDFIEMTKGNRR